MNLPPPHDGLTPSQGPDAASAEPGPVASPSKRRLVRAGLAAVPVVATLASRPAHAWQCRAPSAWSSIQANPNTSLIGNVSHRQFTDETWTLYNWKNNIARSQVSSTKPWKALKDRFGLTEAWDKINVATLMSRCSVRCYGVDGTTKAYSVMESNNFAGNLLAAQLNHILLEPTSDIDRCVSLDELKRMAINQYPTTANPWLPQQVLDYLRENYIVRVS